jgi:rubrerythrin
MTEKRRPGNFDNYRKDKKELWWCKTCGGPVMGARVAHSVWDGPFPCSGYGEVRYSIEPYCPNCETEPSFHGAPIQE